MNMMRDRLVLGIVCFAFANLAVAKPGVPMSLEQAINEVQQQTGGKILSASTLQQGNQGAEYRIKVLTPDGHVRVIPISSNINTNPISVEIHKRPGNHSPGH